MKTLIWLWFNILFLAYKQVYGASERVDPLVLINQGFVKGTQASEGDYSKFLGIPYATVDLNDPFGAARDAPQFEEEIFKAYYNSRVCPQTRMLPLTGKHDESPDCLQLNVFVPYKASTLKPLPVLVWIHGGYFVAGSANEYEPSKLVKQGIVVVTVNYRIGAYGFMCLDDHAVPGNQGLKDQYAALRWVRGNIAAFGGNPYNVTLAGQNAGSASTLLHLFSTKEKLFHKVIAQSGTPLSPNLFRKADPNVAVKLANYLGLDTTDNQQALRFLVQSHHSLVTGASHALGIDFKPCAEKSFSGVDNFVDSEPYALSNERKIRNTPVLIGNTNQEYTSDWVKLMHGEDFYKKDFFYTTLEETFNLEKDQLEKVAEIIRHYYAGDKPISEDIKMEASSFLSDFIFHHPIQDTITSLLRNNANPVYEYVFSYVGESVEEGAAHSTELNYLFEMDDLIRKQRSEADQLMADRLATLWANFVKYGNPTTETSELIPIKWTPVTESTRPYLNIGSELRLEDRFLKERNAFWDLFQSVYGKYSNLARQCDYYK